MPHVSVLMPVFNSEPYLADALASIRDQSFDDFELIVINDGSTDGSSRILRTFAQKESRTRLIERANRGLIDTRNQLLEEARGDLIAWMDSDDLSHPDRLRKQVAAFNADPSLVCLGTNIQRIDPEGCSLGVEIYPQDDEKIRIEQVRGAGLRFASTMQRRSVATDVGGFRHPFRIGEDFDFLLRVGERGKVANLDDALYVYRQHLLNTCTEYGWRWPEVRSAILDLAKERREQGSDKLQRGEQIELAPAQAGDERKLLPVVLLAWGEGAASAGDRPRALRYTMRSIGAAPLRRDGWRQFARLLVGR